MAVVNRRMHAVCAGVQGPSMIVGAIRFLQVIVIAMETKQMLWVCAVERVLRMLMEMASVMMVTPALD